MGQVGQPVSQSVSQSGPSCLPACLPAWEGASLEQLVIMVDQGSNLGWAAMVHNREL
jgi:hypothetical protein